MVTGTYGPKLVEALYSFSIASGATALEVSAIRIEDTTGVPPLFFTVEFDDVSEDALAALALTGSITFIDGSFHDIVSTAIAEADNIDVTATFQKLVSI